MRLNRTQDSAIGEPRYDTGTLRKVAALAARLQSRQTDTLTAQEMEAIGAEVGLEPTFIQQALVEVARKQPRMSSERERNAEFWTLIVAFGVPLLWGSLAYLFYNVPRVYDFFRIVTPWPIALFLGFLTGKKKAGFVAGAELLVIMFLAGLAAEGGVRFEEVPGGVVGFFGALAFTCLLGGLPALVGASIRERYYPISPARKRWSRQELLKLLFALQGQLEVQKQRRAFLSVDVVGSSEMKHSGSELAVEHSFGQFRAWVEGVVRSFGGEMQSAAGDGVMCLFPTDAGAVRAARRLQEGLQEFNAGQNRLPMPFRIRCGVSAGAVPIEEGTPLGHLQSPVIDRAAALQKRAEPGDILVSGEVADVAVVELGGVASLAEPVAGEPAFSWRAAQHISGD